MTPRLIVLSAATKLKNISLQLGEGEAFVVGRRETNALVLADYAVSRHHFRIEHENDRFIIEDLDSHNGTFVNGVPVKRQALAHGDRIRIGKNTFLFSIDDADFDADEAEFKTVENEDFSTGQSVALDDGSIFIKSEIRLNPIEFSRHAAESDLGILIKFGEVLNNEKDAIKLRCRFLEIVLEFIPAERAAILLFGAECDAPESVSVSSRRFDTGDEAPMTVSRTVTEIVLREKIAILSNDLSDRSLASAKSLIASQIASLLCVPVKTGIFDGLIYLDSSDENFAFTENHLQQMTAVSFLISAALERAEAYEELQKENARLQSDLEIETNIVGESEAIQKVFRLITKVAETDSTVLLTGESGTGKELAAQTIHRNSPRRDKPFVAVNCAVLNDNLLESELFGHEKGAFTGAIAQKKGRLEIAAGGTIFLDEIYELAQQLQAKLLRVIQEREYERVGGTKTLKTDVRIITATNRNLADEVRLGRFREDLYFRLNVVQIKMPALRERSADIALLTRHFVKKYGERARRKITGVSPEALKILNAYEWRGNVRELENVIERAIVLGSTETILIDDLPEEMVESVLPIDDTSALNYHEQIKSAKRKIVLDALEKSGGNFTDAARFLGIHANNLHRLTRELEIKPKKDR